MLYKYGVIFNSLNWNVAKKGSSRILQSGKCIRNVHASSALNAGYKWRLDHNMPGNPMSRGILVDTPDYTFLDGRITPYTSGQRLRIITQQEYAKKIVHLVKIVDMVKDRYAQKQQNKSDRINRILNFKLKPKAPDVFKTKLKDK